MEERHVGAVPTRKTHIHDLPDGCLAKIMGHVSSAFDTFLPIPRPWFQNVTVQHPLQCALVCKHWRALADTAVDDLSFNVPFERIVPYLGNRFTHLRALRLSPAAFGTWSDAYLASLLAGCTPSLERFEVDPPPTASVFPVLEALSRWVNLQQLNLGRHLCSRSADDAETLLDAICNLPALEHLSFGFGANLPAVFSRLGAMSRLSTLQLDCPAVPPVLSGRLPQILQRLVLRNFGGTQLPNSLGLFTRLEALEVHTAKTLKAFPETLGCLSHLTKLEVIDCKRLASLPNSVGQLESLQVLQVNSCAKSWAWPESIDNLPALRTLLVSQSGALPEGVGHASDLETLKLAGGAMLSEDVRSLCNLQKLDYSDVAELPASLSHLRSLALLRLSGDFPVCHPADLGTLTSLRQLEIHDCWKLKGLPYSLGRLVNLELFKLNCIPCLKSLPESIGEWRSLVSLEIVCCWRLRCLPERLGHLRALKELSLRNCNALDSLPRSVGGLSRLQYLRLHSCPQLAALPATIGEIRTLRAVDISQCISLDPLPKSLRQRSDLRIRHS